MQFNDTRFWFPEFARRVSYARRDLFNPHIIIYVRCLLWRGVCVETRNQAQLSYVAKCRHNRGVIQYDTSLIQAAASIVMAMQVSKSDTHTTSQAETSLARPFSPIGLEDVVQPGAVVVPNARGKARGRPCGARRVYRHHFPIID